MKVLRCHVGHTTIFHRPLPSAVLLRKLTIIGREDKRTKNRTMVLDTKNYGAADYLDPVKIEL